ncbi:MAG: right-handed parallel beta-helix repeat-containing protein [Candidatus Bathyarchaeota archaeon]|nr:right-handed parallel beta-helix repeat-containing protein [Candidatus Bathyarchaeota archaeon]
MHTKKALGIVLTLLLISSAVVTGTVKPDAFTAPATIYIRPDGSVSPATAPIQRAGDTYTLANEIYSPFVLDESAIVVERANIVLDGAEYSLTGIGHGQGINVSRVSNVTIQNLEIKRFGVGIIISESANNTIFRNVLTENDVGIGLWQVSNNKISGNIIIANNGTGIAVSGNGAANSIVGNFVANNKVGIGFGYGSLNIVAENYIANNEEGVYFGGNPPFAGASNNTFYRNSFINNTKQVNDYHWTTSFSAPSMNIWDKSSAGNYWSDYKNRYPNAKELNSSGVWNTPYVLDQYNKDNYPLVGNPLSAPADIVPPAVSILSPENKSYAADSIALTCAVNETVFRMAYSIDGKSNVAIAGNTTLPVLSEGSHNIVVYAIDSFGNVGASAAVFFTIDLSPPHILILSPQNKTYDTTDIPLTFEINEPISGVAYSLNGQAEVIISGNATLAVLPEGSHHVVVYANDTAGNSGVSEVVYFSVAPFPVILVAAVVAIVVIVGAVALIYVKKPKKNTLEMKH